MGRKSPTLRVLFTGNVIRLPDVSANVVSSGYSFLMTALSFFKEIAEGNGSRRITEGDRTYWEARFGELETIVVDRWLSRHEQYERVGTMEELFIIPLETGKG